MAVEKHLTKAPLDKGENSYLSEDSLVGGVDDTRSIASFRLVYSLGQETPSSNRMVRWGRFMQLLRTFFAEFMEAFFPEIQEHIDFSVLKPLSEQMYTDLIDGKSQTVDILIETKLKNEDTIIIIHVEPQSYHETDFNERMFRYYSSIYQRERKSILPITVFSYNEVRNEKNQFTMSFPFFHVLTFNFLMLELRKMNWRSYIHTNNPVAAALLSKMGYSEKEKVQVKKEFLRMLVKMKLNPAKAALINGFFETYLTLNKKEEEELMEEIKQLDQHEAEQIFELPNSWRDKGRKEGIQEGIRKVALEMLKKGLSIEFIAEVTKLDDKEILDLKRNL